MSDTNSTIISPSPPASLSTSLAAFRRSQTFLAQLPDPRVFRLRLFTVTSILAFFFLIVPLFTLIGWIEPWRVTIMGRYLAWAIVAIGIDLIWGYTGILSLCQAFFFCLGAYAMSMHLSLKEGGGDVRPEYNNIPQFMFFNNVHELPAVWKLFGSMPLTLLMAIVLPSIVAGIFGFFIFRSRVRGVYFSIVTQAAAWGAWLLISRNEMLLGGTNGLTNFSKALTTSRSYILSLYITTLVVLALAYLLCRAIIRSKLGRVLVAIRDKETRLYFAGYRPYAFKVFAFTVAAALAGVGGMLYAPQTTLVAPQLMSVNESIYMVIWVALGGRGKLWGAIFGALLVNYTKGAITSDMPSVWELILGLMYLGVVLGFPDGIVGVWDTMEKSLKRGDNRSFTVMACVLGGVVLFILTQALGWMPPFLRDPLSNKGMLADIPPLKYFILLALLLWGVIYFRLSPRTLAVTNGGGK